MSYPKKCPECQAEFKSPYSLYKHKRAIHGWVPTPKATAQKPLETPFDRLISIKSQVKDLMNDLEAERSRLHDRLIQIDTTLAQYKKGCLPV